MSFETSVLAKVADSVGSEIRAEFTSGTLFVECSETEARKVFHRLSKDFGLGKVKVSSTPAEYAFDFVA